MTTPTPERWTAVKALFEAAAARPAAEREALLAASGLDSDALAEVRSLLQHHDSATAEATHTFLGGPAATEPPPAAPDSRAGERLGPWRISQRLGSGGMGDVWLAERDDGAYAGQAAIKVLKRGMDSGAVLERFAQEQQALARLNHPHIAHLLDAGRTADGLPYFVMERVHGQPIDAACKGQSLNQRLDLFLQLADAVSHAHRQLLVHRDLKPGNVLVTPELQVKLLDFGIAKALDPLDQPLDGSLITQAGERPFTPLYASPEQVRGEPVGTATDIYSLGVLLYVMLTGVRPYGRSASTPLEAARSVLEEEPSRPSALGPDLAADPDWLRLRQRLKGDLDNILLKALAKDLDARYASVDALMADVRAYLGGQPVSARPASTAYVVGKFVRRNRVAVGAAGAAVLALVVGLGAALHQADRATRAQAAGQVQLAAVKDLLRGLVLRYSYGVWLTPKGGRLMQAFVEDALPRLEKALAAAPGDMELAAIAADLYSRLAEMLGSNALGTAASAVTAQRAAERAIALGDLALPSRRGDGAFVARLATARLMLSSLALQAGRPADGLALLDAAQRDIDAALPLAAAAKDIAGTAYLRGARGSTFMFRGQLYDHGNAGGLNKPEEALAQFALALQEYDAFLADPAGIAAITAAAPDDDIDTAASVLQAVGATRTSMAMVHLKQGVLPPAQAEAARALGIYQRIVDNYPPNVAFRDGLVTAGNLASHLALRAGDAPAALAAAQTAWTVNGQLVQSEGPKSKWAGLRPWVAVQYGSALAAAGRAADAAPVLREAAEHWTAQVQAQPQAPTAGRSMRRAAQSRLWLARALQAQGQRAAALDAVQAGITVLAPAAADPKRSAETLLLQAELHALRADLGAASAPADRTVAREAAQAALALPTLASDQRALAERLQKP